MSSGAVISMVGPALIRVDSGPAEVAANELSDIVRAGEGGLLRHGPIRVKGGDGKVRSWGADSLIFLGDGVGWGKGHLPLNS